jgi:glycosyltransferase involved in cell wall biosynthesis
MKIFLSYRNYKSLHTIHQSLITNPPIGCNYVIPKGKKGLRKFYNIYKNHRSNYLVKKSINLFQKYLFSKPTKKDNMDLVHYVQLVAPRAIKDNIPYVIDLEHIIGLTNFCNDLEFFKRKVRPFLESSLCKRIIPMSHAAKKTLSTYYGKDFDKISTKTEVVYPALPSYEVKKDFTSPKLRLLFVGNQVYRKGLHELLIAIGRLPKEILNLTVISDSPKSIVDRYKRENITFLKPKFTHEAIIDKFFSRADLFVMPTHLDTFGMVFLDALSCGTPVLTTNQFATPEIIDNNVNGILLDTKKRYTTKNPVYTQEIRKDMMKPEVALVEQLRNTLLKIYKNKDVLPKMSLNARKLFQNPHGKFSLKKRNITLKRIYQEAL